MAVANYEELKAHVGHRVVVASYGDADNVAIECETCFDTLLDFDRPGRTNKYDPDVDQSIRSGWKSILERDN